MLKPSPLDHAAMVAMPSPCIGVCKMDDAERYCLGCARTKPEIAEWGRFGAERKAQTFAELPARRAELGYGAPVMGLPIDRMDHRLLAALEDPAAAWAISAPGVSAEYRNALVKTASSTVVGTDAQPDADGTGDQPEPGEAAPAVVSIGASARLWEFGGEVRSHGGGMRLVLDHSMQKIKFLGFAADGSVQTDPNAGADRIDICLYKRKAFMGRRAGLTELGPDFEALYPSDRDSVLFDLALGVASLDFCVRVSEPKLLSVLRAHLGQSLMTDPHHPVMDALRVYSPDRVMMTRLGRIEVTAPIPAPSEASPTGPHTHFDMAAVLKGIRTGPDYAPDTLVPVISLYPSAPMPFYLPVAANQATYLSAG